MKACIVAVLVVTGLMFVTVPGICFGEDLVVNGGFEQKSDSAPLHWEYNRTRDTKADISLDDTTKHSGNYSYKIDIAPPGGRVTLYPEKDSMKKPATGRTYRVSLWIKARNLDYNQFFVAPAVRVNFRPTRIRPVPTIDLMAYMKGVKDWTELTMDVTVPGGAEGVHLDIILTKGTVWLDDISIAPVDGR